MWLNTGLALSQASPDSSCFAASVPASPTLTKRAGDEGPILLYNVQWGIV